MKHNYQDIRDRIPDDPQWWDEHGVPRYCTFGPGSIADIYATQTALLLIRCQSCRREFQVCLSSGVLQRDLSRWIDDHGLHYGDPPNAECCAAGPTMNSEPIRVMEFWARNDNHVWCRRHSYEREIEEHP